MNALCAGRSDVGVKRDLNEDRFHNEPEQGLFLVADGMGGHAGGELAGRLAVETIARFVAETRAGTTAPLPFRPRKDLSPESNRIYVGARLANLELYETALSNPPLAGMAATLVGLLLHGREAHVVHVGDCRGYILRGEKLRQLTHDHTVVNDLIAAGELNPDAAYRHPDRNKLTQALGADPDVEPEVTVLPVQTGDLFLLCSDGLTDLTSERRLLELLAPLFPEALEHAERRVDVKTALDKTVDDMVRYANSRGGDDNITVVLVKLVE